MNEDHNVPSNNTTLILGYLIMRDAMSDMPWWIPALITATIALLMSFLQRPLENLLKRLFRTEE
jgi:CDP-diglyceride synthetase